MTDEPGVPDAGELDELDDEGTLLMEQRFAIVPEWVLDAEISDAALRLYAVLLRYGQTSGNRMPSRKLLATRMQKKSRDTVDRALKELVSIGAVVVQRRRQGPVNLTNRYIVRSTPAGGGRTNAATPEAGAGGRISAAGGSRKPAATGGRADAATVAAPLRPDPKHFTQKEPPPPSPSAAPADIPARHLAAALDGHDLDDVTGRCRAARHQLGLPVGRWTARVLGDVLADAVAQGWPAADAVPALLAVAGDSNTRSPARLSYAGPWWDGTATTVATDAGDRAELARLEARLAEADGARVAVQRRARQELSEAGEHVTRLSVARRACTLLDEASAG